MYPISRDGEKLFNCINTLKNVLKNLLKDKNDEKFRKLKLDNQKVKERI